MEERRHQTGAERSSSQWHEAHERQCQPCPTKCQPHANHHQSNDNAPSSIYPTACEVHQRTFVPFILSLYPRGYAIHNAAGASLYSAVRRDFIESERMVAAGALAKGQ